MSDKELSEWSNELLSEALNETTIEIFGKPLDVQN
jgi:hypothetical protein